MSCTVKEVERDQLGRAQRVIESVVDHLEVGARYAALSTYAQLAPLAEAGAREANVVIQVRRTCACMQDLGAFHTRVLSYLHELSAVSPSDRPSIGLNVIITRLT